MPGLDVNDLNFDKFKNLWICVSGGLVLHNEAGVIGINYKQIKILPKYELHQNYPNPFNANTIIKYSIYKKSFVIIKLYNVLGQELFELVNELKPIGEYELKIDSKNLSSGIYFYKLIGDNYSNTKKMIVIK